MQKSVKITFALLVFTMCVFTAWQISYRGDQSTAEEPIIVELKPTKPVQPTVVSHVKDFAEEVPSKEEILKVLIKFDKDVYSLRLVFFKHSYPDWAVKLFHTGFFERCNDLFENRDLSEATPEIYKKIINAYKNFGATKIVTKFTEACLRVIYQQAKTSFTPSELRQIMRDKFVTKASEEKRLLQLSEVQKDLRALDPKSPFLAKKLFRKKLKGSN